MGLLSAYLAVTPLAISSMIHAGGTDGCSNWHARFNSDRLNLRLCIVHFPFHLTLLYTYNYAAASASAYLSCVRTTTRTRQVRATSTIMQCTVAGWLKHDNLIKTVCIGFSSESPFPAIDRPTVPIPTSRLDSWPPHGMEVPRAQRWDVRLSQRHAYSPQCHQMRDYSPTLPTLQLIVSWSNIPPRQPPPTFPLLAHKSYGRQEPHPRIP